MPAQDCPSSKSYFVSLLSRKVSNSRPIHRTDYIKTMVRRARFGGAFLELMQSGNYSRFPTPSAPAKRQLKRNAGSATMTAMGERPTILVFDSGLGGLTVLREIVRARHDAHHLYVADDAFFPYGHHGEEQIIARVVPLIGELIARHAPDLVVIACNTASTLVMSHLRERYQVPFVGTVPAIKPAC